MRETESPERLLAHSEFVRDLAQSLLDDGAAADDLAQETWRRALERPPRRAGSPRPWLATLVRNGARRMWREEWRRRGREREVARGAAEAYESADRGDEGRRVVDAVLELSPIYRQVVLMRFFDGLGPREIAQRIDAPVETVRTRLSRALASLRRRLSSGRDGSGAWATVAGIGACRPWRASVLATSKAAAVVVFLAAAGVWSLSAAAPRELSDKGPGEGPPSFALAEEPRAGSGSDATAAAARRANGRSMVAAMEGLLQVAVVDTQGVPFAGVRVVVLGDEDPFPEDCPAPRIGWDAMVGRSFLTDELGAVDIEMPDVESAVVRLDISSRLEPDPDLGGPVTIAPPWGEVKLVAKRNITSKLVVRAYDLQTRQPLSNFVTVLTGAPGHFQRRARGEVVEYEISVGEPGGVEMRLEMIRPRAKDPVVKEFLLLPNVDREIALAVPSEGETSGWVVDGEGRGIDGAHVYFGDETTGRGDEPYRRFRPDWITGVRTAADGWFRLPGTAEQVSVWHPDYSPRTVAGADSARIVLGSRGTIRGRVVDEGGGPIANATLWLDGDADRPVTADAEGRFELRGVEAGVRGIEVDDDRTYAVRVGEGETVDVELGRGLPRVELVVRDSNGETLGGNFHGALLGLDDVARLYRISHWVKTEREPPLESGRLRLIFDEGPHPVLRDVLPGRYLLCSRSGLTAPVTVSGERALAELGACSVTVRGRPGIEAQIAPASLDRFGRLVAARVRPKAGEDGVLRLGPVHPGEYVLLGEAGAVLGRVSVSAPSTEVDLR